LQVSVETLVESGDPRDATEKIHADLLVMGSHEYGRPSSKGDVIPPS
jgi:nucleotide-binding universal stress UspA family protein